MTRILVILLIIDTVLTDVGDKGRKGNASYHDKKYQEAARLFKEGIAELTESTKPSIRTGLFNNLGASLNRLESFEEAAASFAMAVETAGSEQDLSRASYNAGNTAFQAQHPEQALEFYRNALLADPENEDARFNYEFVRRMIEEQKESGDSGENQQQQQQQNDEQEQQEQQEQEQEENEDEQESDQPQEQEQEQNEDEQESDQPQEQEQEPEPQEEMTEEQAEQILDALQNDEEDLMRQVWRMKGKPRSVDKDW